MTNQTLQNEESNRGNNEKEALENALRTLWLHKAGATQTQRKELVNDLLNRYSSLESCLHLFRNFSFIAKEPKVVLVL